MATVSGQQLSTIGPTLIHLTRDRERAENKEEKHVALEPGEVAL